MSETEREHKANERAAQGAEAQDVAARAVELSELVAELTERFLSIDSHDAASLEDICQQIEDLAAQCDAARAELPPHLAVAFDSVDEALNALAERIAEAPAADGDHELVAASAMTDADGAWDPAAAEALTQMYESDPEVFAPVYEAAQAAPTYGAPSTTPLSSTSALDATWIEQRFANIAEQVAQTLAASDAEASFGQIGRRLDDIEGRFDAVLQDAGTRAEAAPLDAIEASLAGLADKFEVSQRELSRVNSIEQQIAALADQLSDERIAALITTTRPDPAAVAELLAERFAIDPKRLPFAANGAFDEHGIGELRQLVADLAERQDIAGAQTKELLVTVQQALDRVLKRIDLIEPATRASEPVKAEPEIGEVAADEVASEPTLEAVPADEPPQPLLATHEDHEAIEPARQDDEAIEASAETEAELKAEPQPELDASSDTNEDATEEDDRQAKRTAFIEAARRAAQNASLKASGALEPSLAVPGEDHDEEFEPTFDELAEIDEDLDLEDIDFIPAEHGPKSETGSRTRLLIAGVALVVLAAGVGAYAVSSMMSGDAARVAGKPTDRAAQTTAAATTVMAERADRAQALQPQPQTMASAPSGDQAAIPGISIAEGGAPLTRDELAKLESQQRRARMSADVANNLPIAKSVPAALVQGGTSSRAGTGVASDAARARSKAMIPPAAIGPTSLRQSAANGHPSAEFEVGARFAEGRGVDQDFKQAAHWYERSAKQGFAIAQYRLATLHERGMGVSRNLNLAKYWYLKAANQGTVKAMHNLAVLTAGQSGGKPNYANAARWFSMAAERGLADSQFNLGILYSNGLGVSKDLTLAYKWFALAARSGDKEAKQQERVLLGQLKGPQRSAADQQIATWRQKTYDKFSNDPAEAGRIWQRPTSAS